MMNFLKIGLVFTSYILALPYAEAQSSGAGGGSWLTWTCSSLAEHQVTGWRWSSCLAHSPDGVMATMGGTVRVRGRGVLKSDCSTGEETYDESSYDEIPGPGSTEWIGEDWFYYIADYSFSDNISATIDYTFIQWTPPNPSGGSSSVGPFQNTVGGCY